MSDIKARSAELLAFEALPFSWHLKLAILGGIGGLFDVISLVLFGHTVAAGCA